MLESCVIDLVALMESVGSADGVQSYDVRLRLEPELPELGIKVWGKNRDGDAVDPEFSIDRSLAVTTTFVLDDTIDVQAQDLALDLVTPGGTPDLQVLALKD